MKVEDIIKVIEALGKTDLTEFYLEQNDLILKMGKGTGTVFTTTTTVEPQPKQEIVVSQPVAQVQPVAHKEAPAVEQKDDAKNDNLVKIVSPMVGTFYQSPSPDSPPFVKVGDVVGMGDTLCIVEAMKLMNEIESTENGKIVKILVENGELVEYGQTLFLVEPV